MKLSAIRNVRPAKAAAVLAVVAGAIFASVLPSSADVSTASPSAPAIRVLSPAQLEARGAGLAVDVTATCPAGSRAYFYVEVTQRVGSEIARGYVNHQIDVCTGAPETVTTHLAVSDKPFQKGVAYASGVLQGSFTNVYDKHEIQIIR